jgi:hypothetical protein
VLAGVLSEDPTEPGPTLIAFSAGGAVFFAIVFGAAWRASSRRADPELDVLLQELALEPQVPRANAASIRSTRRIARAYILLGALVTALGLAAVAQQGVTGGDGDPRVFLYPLGAIVVLWAMATPVIVKTALANSAAVLAPLGLTTGGPRGATMSGERHGRSVAVHLRADGSTVELECPAPGVSLEGDEALARAARGRAETWTGTRVKGDDRRIVVSRDGQDGPAWLWDLWLAEKVAGERG